MTGKLRGEYPACKVVRVAVGASAVLDGPGRRGSERIVPSHSAAAAPAAAATCLGLIGQSTYGWAIVMLESATKC